MGTRGKYAHPAQAKLSSALWGDDSEHEGCHLSVDTLLGVDGLLKVDDDNQKRG